MIITKIAGVKKMSNQLPAIKLQPQTIPFGNLLNVIDLYAGNYQKIDDEVYELWVNSSQRTKPPNRRNALRAVIGPSLRHLELIRGIGNDFKLTGSGKRILEAFKREGEGGLKKELAIHLIRIDKEKWFDLLGKLQNANGQLSINELCRDSKENLLSPNIEEGNLRKYVRFFEYCGLVSSKNNLIIIHEKQVDAARLNSFPAPSANEFIGFLVQAYNSLKQPSRGYYVSIPDLRDSVCAQTGLFPDDFDKLLTGLPLEGTNYTLQYGQPMDRHSGGIVIGNIYMYYLAIYPGRS